MMSRLMIVMAYGAMGGAGAFVARRLCIRLDMSAGPMPILGAVAWPLALPACLTYLALHTRTPEYREQKLREENRKLSEAIEEAKRLAEEADDVD